MLAMKRVILEFVALMFFYMAFDAKAEQSLNDINHYVLVNAFRGDEFMTEFDYEIDSVVHDGYSANYIDQNETLMKSVGFRGNRFIISSGQDCAQPKKISVFTKKKWNSGLFVLSVNHVPQGRMVSGSIIFSGDKNLHGKVEFITGPTHCTSETATDDVKWQGNKLCANSMNKLRKCSTHILVFELMPNKKSCNFWVYSISEAPLDLLNEKPRPERWTENPKVIDLFEQKKEVTKQTKEKFEFVNAVDNRNGTLWQLMKPAAINRNSDEGFSIGVVLLNDFADKNYNQKPNEGNSRCNVPDPGAFWELNYVKVYQKSSATNCNRLVTLEKNSGGTIKPTESNTNKKNTRKKSSLETFLSSLFSYLPTPCPLNLNINNGNEFLVKTNKAMENFQETLKGLINVNAMDLNLSKLNLKMLNLGDDKENLIKKLFPDFDPIDLESILSSGENLMNSSEFKRDINDAINFFSRNAKRRLFADNEITKRVSLSKLKQRRLQASSETPTEMADVSLMHHRPEKQPDLLPAFDQIPSNAGFYSPSSTVVMYPMRVPLTTRTILAYNEGKQKLASVLTTNVSDDVRTAAHNARNRAADFVMHGSGLLKNAIIESVTPNVNVPIEYQMHGSAYNGGPVQHNRSSLSNVLSKLINIHSSDPYRNLPGLRGRNIIV